ncbi:LPS-assembly protein LptD [Polymorphobacter fuscus]|uniref:LPS-assembly protein LptD n=1 Tax=Sandarakinorhabdus fusca TaxID=1439888 RepID=A0A7C9KVZ5_9SPHN|nr:LPS assembly protein LptD [Polymorphobacter fuscus]KAB7648719.1 LPS-assembly protein LptD [Polymorphobacter fuscus]MQT16282.1 LPS assembly protein LptD [Polymorphobacter fuscus]NJC07433.1 LPS-assembly protein [Polymorphobacter fuscus]
MPPAESPVVIPGSTVPLPRDGGAPVAEGDVIGFAADEMRYDDRGQIVTASGNVRLNRDAWRLAADAIEYNQLTGVVIATGNVVAIDPEGNQALGDRIELTDSLRDGAIDNMLLVLNDGGRLAAVEGQRSDQVFNLRRAVYSPCAVVGSDGCPQTPAWQIKALRISYNRGKHRLSYRNASLELFGVPVMYLPSFSHPDGEAKQASGLLLPGIKLQRQLGLGISLPYHFALAPDRDITVTPWFYTAVNPALQLQGRRLFAKGPIEIDSLFTYTRLGDADANGNIVDKGNRFRGYFALKGNLQHTPEWRSRFSVRLTTDDTFNRLYGLGFDDMLRSTYALERQTSDSYLSVAAWAFQGLRITDRAGEIPFVLPLIDYDWRPRDLVLGGRLHFGANSMNLFRTDGQDVARALAFARWDRSLLTPIGQRVTFTGMMRGDVYHVDNADKATLPAYAGVDGLRARAIPVAAVDVEWPFAGPALGGTQTITPRVQLVATPATQNANFPNEDSRAIELEDINLFDLNRFPGYDKFESGTRITYGIGYALDRPGWALTSEIGQSVRIAGDGSAFPAGSGLSDQLSDFVGRTSLKYGRYFELIHRFRVDRSNLAVRRNEFDIQIGSPQTYATIGYIKLNRNILLEDLEDREELRAGGRVAIARYWSVFGSAIVDLTTATSNPLTTGNGFEFIRHRIGAEYEDECFRLGVSWRRDYIGDRDFRPGNSFLLTLAFKTSPR